MRPTKLNAERQRRIIQAIQMGATYEIASEHAGITRKTLYTWLERGKKSKSGLYYTFLHEFKKAESRAALTSLATIQTEIKEGNWKCAAWLLERRHGYKRDSRHRRSDYVENKAPINIDNPIDLLKQQAIEIKVAIGKASASESWQAYAVLNRQLVSLVQQIQFMESEQNAFDPTANISDEQLLSEMAQSLKSLPPILRQSIMEEIENTNANNIVRLPS